jgi:aminopeptidase
MDSRILKHAEVLINYSLALQTNETLMINADVTSLPLAKACYKYALEAGAHPKLRIGWGDITELLLKNANDDQLKFTHDLDITAVKTFDAFLTLMGNENTRSLSNVDPNRMQLFSRGRQELQKLYHERLALGEMRWCGTMFPTQANAQEANMSLSEFEDFVYSACKLDEKDPVAAWKNVEEEQQKICDYLNTKNTLRIISEDTNISMRITGRSWVNCSGKVNFPDGEVFTGPIEDSVEGYIRFSYPAIFQNREIEDVKIWIEKGKAVKATAAKGEEFLNNVLDTDEGSRYVGEVAIGTNYGINKFVKHMLFDEKIGGTVHMALGRSIPESKGINQSVIHWDMLCNMRNVGQILADDELFYKNGKFLI